MAEEVTTTATNEGTPLVSQDMLDAQPTLDELKLPTNEDLQNDETEEDKGAASGEGDGDADGTADDGGTANPPVEEATQTQIEEVADPGEFTPGDYSFEVMVYDEKGESPKSHKINSLEEWDDLLETEPNLGTSAAVLKAERAANRMDRGVEKDKSKWEEAKAEYDQVVEQQKARDTQTIQWQNELDYLVAKSELPPMPKEFHVSTANWNDPSVAKQPAVKAQMELLAYFKTENAARTKAGLQPMTSLLDAYNGFAREQDKAAAAENKQRSIQSRRNAASNVASTSPRPATAAPKGISVGRTGLLG